MSAALRAPLIYPKPPQSNHHDCYESRRRHGKIEVPDPFILLEGNGEEARAWVAGQSTVTQEYLEQYEDRKSIQDRIRSNQKYPSLEPPVLQPDGKWYWSYKSSLQQYKVLYRSRNSSPPDFSIHGGPEQAGAVFIDSNTLPRDYKLQAYSVSPSGDYFAYALSHCGQDTVTVYVRPTSAPFKKGDPSHHIGRLPYVIEDVECYEAVTISWTRDSKGFFYSTFRRQEGAHALFYHHIDKPQSHDTLVMSDSSDPDVRWVAQVTPDGRYLVLWVEGDKSGLTKVHLSDLRRETIGNLMKWEPLVEGSSAEWYYLANDDTKMYFVTSQDAPLYKVVSTELTSRVHRFTDVISEDKEAPLTQFEAVGERFMALVYKRKVYDEICLYDMRGKLTTRLSTRVKGRMILDGGRGQPCFFVHMENFTHPGILYRYDFVNGARRNPWSVCWESKVKGLNPNDFLTEQVFYKSKDGTNIPMFIVRHKDTKRDGSAPTLQWGYGGFSESMDPQYKPAYIAFVQMYGGILAVPNIRGGGEFGKYWHEAGTKKQKVNTVDDFIAASEFLVREKYTSRNKIALIGGSNGGFVVAACVNRAPKGTFGAAVIDSGVLDLLKFTDSPSGPLWCPEYGDPDDPDDFDDLRAISPIHNIPNYALPATLVLISKCDDRVLPGMSYKYLATAQESHPRNPSPLLLRVQTHEGHGEETTDSVMKRQTDILSFIAKSLCLVPRVRR